MNTTLGFMYENTSNKGKIKNKDENENESMKFVHITFPQVISYNTQRWDLPISCLVDLLYVSTGQKMINPTLVQRILMNVS